MSAEDAPALRGAVEAAARDQATAPPAPTPEPASPTASEEEELLCTICGLRACWQAPKNASTAAPTA